MKVLHIFTGGAQPLMAEIYQWIFMTIQLLQAEGLNPQIVPSCTCKFTFRIILTDNSMIFRRKGYTSSGALNDGLV